VTASWSPRAKLSCPSCLFDGGIHFEAPAYYDPGDEYDELNPLGCRGRWMELPLWCESCHGHSALIVAFHKGSVFVALQSRVLP
jgi:hypothetical protein